MTSFLTGLVGSGIGPSLSPGLHHREADRHGIRLVYRLLDIPHPAATPEAVRDIIRAARQLGFDGLNITHPCKQMVIPYLDGLSPGAEQLGAVNTVVFRDGTAIGHNTDITGFTESFRRGMPSAPLTEVVQLGAGGAGRAVAHALLSMGAQHITLVDTDHSRADDLADALCQTHGPGRAVAAKAAELPQALRAAEGLVQATPVGMAQHPGLPLPADLLHPRLWVADIIYRPLLTELLSAARTVGCRTLDGGGMAVFQASHAFRLFTGVEPHVEAMLADFADLVAVPHS